jgi:hypothetical protein
VTEALTRQAGRCPVGVRSAAVLRLFVEENHQKELDAMKCLSELIVLLDSPSVRDISGLYPPEFARRPLTGLLGIRKVLFEDPADPGAAIFVAKGAAAMRPEKSEVELGVAGVEGCGAIGVQIAGSKEFVSEFQ